MKGRYQIGVGAFGFKPVLVELEYPPPCLYCADPVTSPSMDGPLVCGWCDMGSNKDGTKWNEEEYKERSKHFSQMVEKYRADGLQDD